jgi:hypothetical protein
MVSGTRGSTSATEIVQRGHHGVPRSVTGALGIPSGSGGTSSSRYAPRAIHGAASLLRPADARRAAAAATHLVARAVELARLPGYGRRHPSQLAGGQQRIALAPALVFNLSALMMIDDARRPWRRTGRGCATSTRGRSRERSGQTWSI